MCRRDAWRRGREDDSPRGRSIVQVRPGAVDFLQLAKTGRTKVVNPAGVPRLLLVHTELPIELFPREAQRSLEGEHPVREPEVQVERQDASREAEIQQLRAKIGELVIERDFYPRPSVVEPRPKNLDG